MVKTIYVPNNQTIFGVKMKNFQSEHPGASQMSFWTASDTLIGHSSAPKHRKCMILVSLTTFLSKPDPMKVVSSAYLLYFFIPGVIKHIFERAEPSHKLNGGPEIRENI